MPKGKKTRGALLGLTMLLAACGGDNGSDHQSLVGDWTLELPKQCLSLVSFAGDGTYFGGVICELTDGTYGVETERGDYAASNGSVSMVPHRASCLTSDHSADDSPYEITGDTLVVHRPEGALIFKRAHSNPADAPSTIVSTGCWDSGLTLFTRSPEVDL